MTFSINNLKYSFHYYFTILFVFLFVFGIPFSFLPVNSSKLVVLFLMFLMIFKFLSNSNLNFSVNKNILKFAFILLLMSFISFAYSFGHNTMDFSIPYAYLIFLIEAVLGSYFLYTLFLKKYTFEEILHILIVLSLIQSIIIISMFIFEPLRDFIFTITESKEELMERYGGFRGFGLAGSVTYDLSVFLSIGMMFITFLVSQSAKNRRFYLISWVVILIAVLMTGRTGWIGVLLSILILLFNVTNKNSLKSLGYLIFLGIISVMSILYILFNFYPEIYKTLILSVVPYAFEMFINLSDTGTLSTSSSDHIENMYFDISEGTFFFGDGYWTNPNGFGYYMKTDAGYMRHILFYGFLPSLFLYLFYLSSFIKMIFSKKRTFNHVLLFSMLCGYYFLAHYKGDFLTGSSMNIKLFAILLVYLVVSKNTLSLKYVDMKGSLN